MYVSMRNFETIPISRLILITPILPLIHNINITMEGFVCETGRHGLCVHGYTYVFACR